MAGRGEFFVTEGTLSQGAECYVVRQADQDLLEALSRGEFAYVLDSRQKGKSSLMIRAREALESAGTRTVLLDLQRFGSNLDPDRWYASMLQVVGEQLDIEDRLFAIWDAQVHAGPMRKFFAALETGLSELGVPCVVFVDEIDFVRSLPFSTDESFAGIRECLNRRAGERVAGIGERETDPDTTRTPSPATRALTFCLLGVATPSELIRDVRITPFNVGKRIELTDFTLAELAPYEAPLSEGGRNGTALLKRIHHWTAGHPYLTQKLASAVAADPTVKTPGGVDRLVEQLFFSLKARSEEPNLADVSRRVLESPIEGIAPEEARARVLDLYRQVRDSRVRDDETDPVVAVLKLSGLTRVLEGYLVVRNRVYFRAFDRSWVDANLPEAEVVRQKKAARRAALRTSILLITSILGLFGVPLAFYGYWLSDQNGRLAEERRVALLQMRAEKERADANAAQMARLARRETDARTISDQRAKDLATVGIAKAAALAEAMREKSRAAIERDRSIRSAKVARQQAQLAQNESHRANHFRDLANLTAYASRIALLGPTWQEGNFLRYEQLINETESMGKHRFEWHLWKSMYEGQPVRILPGIPNAEGTQFLSERRIIQNDPQRTAVALALNEDVHSVNQLGWTLDSRYAFLLKGDLVLFDPKSGAQIRRYPTSAQRVLPLRRPFDFLAAKFTGGDEDRFPVTLSYLSAESVTPKWSHPLTIDYKGAREDLLQGATMVSAPDGTTIVLQTGPGEITSISMENGARHIIRNSPTTLVEMAIGSQFKSLSSNSTFIAALSTSGVLTIRDSLFRLRRTIDGKFKAAFALADGLFVIDMDGKGTFLDLFGNPLFTLHLGKERISELFEPVPWYCNGTNEVYTGTAFTKSIHIPLRQRSINVSNTPQLPNDTLLFKISADFALATNRTGGVTVGPWTEFLASEAKLSLSSHVTAIGKMTPDEYVLGCYDGTIATYNCRLQRTTQQFRLSEEPISDILRVGSNLIVGTFAGDVFQLPVQTLNSTRNSLLMDHPVSCLGTAGLDRYLVGDWQGNVFYSNVSERNSIFITRLSFVPWKLWENSDGSIVALSTSECALLTRNGTVTSKLVFDSPITDFDRSPDGQSFVVVDSRGSVRLIESSELRDLGLLPVQVGPTSSDPLNIMAGDQGLVRIDDDGLGIRVLHNGKLMQWRWSR